MNKKTTTIILTLILILYPFFVCKANTYNVQLYSNPGYIKNLKELVQVSENLQLNLTSILNQQINSDSLTKELKFNYTLLDGIISNTLKQTNANAPYEYKLDNLKLQQIASGFQLSISSLFDYIIDNNNTNALMQSIQYFKNNKDILINLTREKR